MSKLRFLLIFFIAMGLTVAVNAEKPHLPQGPVVGGSNSNNTQSGYRADCTQSTSQTDLDVNNVRARLLGGGDMWWDFSNARYVVPKIEAGSGLQEVSAVYAGAIWLGGFDDGGNLKMAAQTYRNAARNDFWSGPLDVSGATDEEICNQWDRHFEVSGDNILAHITELKKNGADGIDCAEVSSDLLGWPGKGNPHFAGIHGFELPFQDLAPFFDENGDGLYNPCDGDFPVIEIIGCEDNTGQVGKVSFADQMIWYVFNDNGGIHTNTTGDPIRMEIQTLAFAYKTGDQVNDMTFYRYKLVNRANQSIDSTFFGQWVDADLGCATDDFIGCDTAESLMVIYNDGTPDGAGGCGAIPTYGSEVPMLGVDYFRGPKDENGNELGMSSFIYYVNGGYPGQPNTGDPQTGQQFYNYISGTWRDGSPYYATGNGYQQSGPTTNYVFPGDPSDANAWSMCTENIQGADMRTVQASGPFRLDPGAINELIMGVVFVPNVQDYPCPSMSTLLAADGLAQALYDNCFKITDGPDAPNLDVVELDKKLVLLLTNDEASNNYKLRYEEKDLQGPPGIQDTMYVFEGYKVYQLASPTFSDLTDADQARLILQTDLNNNIDAIYNWEKFPGDVASSPVYIPTLEVDGQNDGIQSSLVVTEDQFAEGDRTLVNHKTYYFVAVAYAYNNYEAFDPITVNGQKTVYLEGRRNVVVTPGIPRIPTPEFGGITLNADYGDGAVITRLDGAGTGINFLNLSEETKAEALANNCASTLVYAPGGGPITVKVVDPLRVQPGTYEVTIYDENLNDNKIDASARWKLTTPSGDEWFSDTTLNIINEQVLAKRNQEGQSVTLGISLTIGQVAEPGAAAVLGVGETNGLIGATETYGNLTGTPWYGAVAPGNTIGNGIINYVPTASSEPYNDRDPQQVYKNVLGGAWVPYTLTQCNATEPFFSPAWEATGSFCGIVQGNNKLSDLRNVNIVYTSDKTLWSRCVVVETARTQITNEGFSTEGNKKNFEPRGHASVNKDGVDDGSGTTGMGWFPGYAIDVETGCRLNIFFGENSVYRPDEPSGILSTGGFIDLKGGDMLFNPTADQFIDIDNSGFPTGSFELPLGGQHFVYVSKTTYDECATIASKLASGNLVQRVQVLNELSWTSFPILAPGATMASIEKGLIPNDLTVKLRVNNAYSVSDQNGVNNGYPKYQFTLDGVAPTVGDAAVAESALDLVNVVPNPYYAYSAYEPLNTSNIVKITNLPPTCTITIYSLDGKFIRKYNRAENSNATIPTQGVIAEQMNASLEWDLKNARGIPVASGVYLINVNAPGIGERTIKWFGVARTFDTYRN